MDQMYIGSFRQAVSLKSHRRAARFQNQGIFLTWPKIVHESDIAEIENFLTFQIAPHSYFQIISLFSNRAARRYCYP